MQLAAGSSFGALLAWAYEPVCVMETVEEDSYSIGPDPNSKWFLQGIVSVSPRRRGTSLCDPTYYTVFTKVGVYVKWLQSVLAPLEPPTLKNTTEGEALIQHLHF
ncbi:unnamed protein product [Timema podura]|uniref:Peptidase S1 domain-containing protein n=1 Tax=Timema podura TaxID=61482 RepID=A0ABN7P0L8_TIMPD|nr:unnamed protein product [Timema podura]